eukprot:6606504-Pyramimonas_sp.AAC.1
MREYQYIARGAITHMINSMKFSLARQWHQRPTRVAFQGQRMWKDKVSASRFCAECKSDCLPALVSDSLFVSGLFFLRALPGCWRLPVWHAPGVAAGAAKAALLEWTQA